ncbi:MAG TPA: AAA family ATPase [Burkholderiaceae bacterium]|nr:AAA family ATPase [Burkholderiaceae bacterium]
MSATSGADGRGERAAQPPGPCAELTAAQQRQLVLSLIDNLVRDGVAPRHIETHISHVLLLRGHAYKIKKALATSFLDQSTLARRRAACAEELRLNRRLAPQLYLDVVPITGTLDAPVLGGDGPALEVALKMRAFDDDGLWDRLAARGALCADDVDDLAAVLARFHAEAAVAEPTGWLGTPAQLRSALQDSLRDLQAPAPDAAWPDAIDRLDLARLQSWEAEDFPRLEATMRHRLAAGRVREGHGDLHLGNVARADGRCLVFDGIEFNAEFRWIDVMSDVAFMAMDLHAHRLPGLAHRFVNAYLQHSGDYDGMRVFDYYLVHRALVRAKVAQLRATQAAAGEGNERDAARAAAHRYLLSASRFATPRPRALLITHGLSGSGKTTLTQSLLEAIGAPRIRADVERKRLAGLAPLQGSRSMPGAGLYDAAMNAAVYTRLLDAASVVLEGGWPVILDATFLRRADRDAARRHAAALGVPFVILHFTAAPELLRERVRQRAAQAQDASEADATVLALQAQAQEPLQPDEWASVHAVQASTSPAPAPRADWAPLLARLGMPTPSNGA